MHPTNRFRHQPYTDQPPTSPPLLVEPPSYPAVGSREFAARMLLVGDRLREQNVRLIYLVHGSFVGPDALGIVGELGRLFPGAADRLREIVKRLIDAVGNDTGNYSPEYARLFEAALNQGGGAPIGVRLFHWSSENNHIGRADGAIRLIDELAAIETAEPCRVLLWGHSHAGNVFALVSNLLAGDADAIEAFFQAARVYYRWPCLGIVDVPHWQRVAKLLSGPRRPLERLALDLVTFGTPLRYGWNLAGYSRLLHFIHHAPTGDRPAYLAAFPPRLEAAMQGTGGDLIQQLGIAGTDFVPSLFSWRAFWADSRLDQLLEPDYRRSDLVANLKAGARVPEQGTTLLVNYGPPRESLAQHHLGHAVYTKERWLLFHAEQVAQRLYGLPLPQGACAKTQAAV